MGRLPSPYAITLAGLGVALIGAGLAILTAPQWVGWLLFGLGLFVLVLAAAAWRVQRETAEPIASETSGGGQTTFEDSELRGYDQVSKTEGKGSFTRFIRTKIRRR